MPQVQNCDDTNDYNLVYSCYDNLDCSKTLFSVPGIESACSSYKMSAIPLTPLSNDDYDEFYSFMLSTGVLVDRDAITADLQDEPLILSYDSNEVKGEYLHSTVHLNKGQIATAAGDVYSTSYIPEFVTFDEEYYYTEFDTHKNDTFNLINGVTSLADIVSYNNEFLSGLHIPYMDESIELYTQKIRSYSLGDNKKVVACFGQAALFGVPIDYEDGYTSELKTDLPCTWRCVTFYVDDHTIDAIDSFRGLCDVTCLEKININKHLKYALDTVSDALSHERLFVVDKVEFLYECFPVGMYDSLYMNKIPVRWNESFLLYPVWKIVIHNSETGYNEALIVDPVDGSVQAYRIVNLGY